MAEEISATPLTSALTVNPAQSLWGISTAITSKTSP
jgi:hypothetical protein